MFLALTALGDWWDKDCELLLLGSWCAPYHKRAELASRRFQILPSPWENLERLQAASAYADGVYERLLPLVAARLNAACGVDEPLEYWRVLLGMWLLHFVHSVYDRYTHLSDAFANTGGLTTAVLTEPCFRTPPTTAIALAWLSQDDHYNWQLLSEVIASMGVDTLRQECSVAPSDVASAPTPRRHSGLGQHIGAIRNHVMQAVSPGVLRVMTGKRAWLTEISTSRASLLGIAVRSGFRVIPAPVRDELRDAPAVARWDDRRMSLANLPATDGFEALCARLVPRHLPTVFLEGYENARRTIRRRYPRTPAVLVSETAWYQNDTYKYLAAEALGRGVRLVGVQHGAYYGFASPMPVEAVERAIASTYFVWGWANGHRSLKNLPHPIVNRRPRRPTSVPERILFAPQSMQRYIYRLGSTPSGSLWEPQCEWQARFVASLPVALQRRLTLRPPPSDWGQAVEERLRDRCSEIAVDAAGAFKQAAALSRIVVLEKPGTATLESLAMNVPTIAFWDPNLWDFRDEARPYVDALRHAGVVWHSPELAASHLAAVYDNPSAWWTSDAVQRARGGFVERYALVRDDWARYWIQALRQELAAATVAGA